MRKLLPVIFALLVLLSVVNAQVEVTAEPVKDTVFPDQSAKFDLTIRNIDEGKHTFSIAYLDIAWIFDVNPSQVELSSGDSQKVSVTFTPKLGVEPYIYIIPINVYSESNPFVKGQANLKVKVVSYENALTTKFKTSGVIDPTKEALAVLELNNPNSIELNNVNLQIASNFLNVEKKLNFRPLEKKTEEFKLNIPRNTERGIYNVNLKVSIDGKTIYDNVQELNVGFAGNVQEIKDVSESFLLKKVNVIKTNNGDMDTREVYSMNVGGWFSKTFTRYNVEPYSVKNVDGNYVAEFRFDLKRGQVYRIESVTNYRTAILLLLIIVALIYLGFSFSKERISIEKKVLVVKNQHGISDMRIQLVLKNKGGAVREIKLIDQLPKGIKVPSEYGTIKPSQIKKELNVLTLVWNIPGLLKGEERIVSYRIKDTQVAGQIVVPRAVVKYRTSSRKVITMHSEKTTLFG